MKSVHKYMNEYTGALLDTPAEAIESERETLKEIAKLHWKCKSCNMIISDDNDDDPIERLERNLHDTNIALDESRKITREYHKKFTDCKV